MSWIASSSCPAARARATMLSAKALAAEPLGILPGRPALEPHDRHVRGAPDRCHHQLAHVIAAQARALLEPPWDIRPRLDLHFAPHAVRRANDADDEIFAANRSRG